MGRYLVVSERSETVRAKSRSESLQAKAGTAGYRVQRMGSAAWLAVCGPRTPKTLAVGPWTLIGDVLNRSAPSLSGAATTEPHSYEKKLLRRFWGRYVGIRHRGLGLDAVLRDPSGALDCVTWQDEDLVFVASDIPAWLDEDLPPDWSIDFPSVGAALRDPLRVWGGLLLHGLQAVLPGTLHDLAADGASAVLWAPTDYLPPRHRRRHAPDDAAQILVHAVDQAVADLAGLSDRIGCEVSGGLDSSVVAAALVAFDPSRVKLWLNAYGRDAGADERPYVEALGSELGIAPTSALRAGGPIREEDLLRISQGVRPGLNALDWHYDRAWAALWREAEIDAVMTGKGGDSVFIQAATADVFTDDFKARGWRSIVSRDLPALARLNQRSVWSLIAEARHTRRRGGATDGPTWAGAGVNPEEPITPHPWLDLPPKIGPAKAHQIAGIAGGVAFSAPSAQTEVVECFHPLLSQPVVECALSFSATELTFGGRDRALLRHAYQDRLPPLILDRRSKGDMTAFYGRMIAGSLDVLRPWLLDGRLVAEGLIDRVELERVLSPEILLWKGGYGEIMIAAALEGWVRAWEARLSGPKRPSA